MALITMLTDFGTADPYVAELRGVLHSRAPGVTLVDLSHGVPPGDVRAAAYLLGRAWHRFPVGTVHLVVVDPGVGTGRAALAFAARGHRFVGPDNGVFTAALDLAEESPVALPTPADAAPTFHGRDLFAPAAAALALGAECSALGEALPTLPVRLVLPLPYHEGKTVIGEVISVDRFGNLVTNLTTGEAPPHATLEVEDTEVGRLRRTFSDVESGQLLAYVGSGGQVEIAVRDGSAARRLGLGVGGRVRARLG
ncbi:MAG TPA: SAM-dependent chlorinase/fluorinase [Gemmatimonadales bacterium]|nr:SAM-dependent chlorinase/fluorinase [Gemmatimonadales bacterium]